MWKKIIAKTHRLYLRLIADFRKNDWRTLVEIHTSVRHVCLLIFVYWILIKLYTQHTQTRYVGPAFNKTEIRTRPINPSSWPIHVYINSQKKESFLFLIRLSIRKARKSSTNGLTLWHINVFVISSETAWESYTILSNCFC